MCAIGAKTQVGNTNFKKGRLTIFKGNPDIANFKLTELHHFKLHHLY